MHKFETCTVWQVDIVVRNIHRADTDRQQQQMHILDRSHSLNNQQKAKILDCR